MTTDSADLRLAHRRFRLVAVLVPALLTVLAVALQWAWLDELPDPAATHFSGTSPDGFGAAWTYPVMTAGLAALFLGLTGVMGWQARRTGSWNPGLRLLGSSCPGLLVLLLVALTWTVHSQRGLTDAHDAPAPTWFMLAGLVAGTCYGLVAWFLQPSVRTTPEGVREARAHSLESGEPVVWTRTVRPGRVAGWVMGLSLLLVLAGAVVMTVLDDAVVGAVVLWGVLALLVVAAATTSVFRVRIDNAGLSVRSLVGLPRWQVDLSEITAARSVPVNPLGDFGGWGVRWQPGNGMGIVTRRGEALQVEYGAGKRLTVTVDDSARASDLLVSLRDADSGS